MKRIYLDHAASTPMSSSAWMAMEPILTGVFGNPSSIHAEGVRAKQALEKSHQIIAGCVGAHSDEIILTSSATESINLAILGSLKAASIKNKHVITIGTEHAAVLNTLKLSGTDVTILPVDEFGHVSVNQITNAITSETILISIMFANNEFGVIHDIASIGRAIDAWKKSHGSIYPLFHSDASQAPNYLPIDVAKLHVDLLTLSSAKVYGPKGVGCLYLRRHTPFSSIFGGGKQESGRRPGTENVAGAVGFASALYETLQMLDRESKRLLALREQLIDGLLSIPNSSLNGDRIRRLPNNVNIAFVGIDGEELVLRLDAKGISVSTGSACKGGNEPSHALLALGLSINQINSSVRFSLGRSTTSEEIDKTISITKELVASMR